MWGGLAFEVGRVAHEMELIGLHAEADQVYQHFLKAPGAKPDGDYSDGTGALEWATSLRHDMGYSHDGKLWEHWHLGNYDPCHDPDNGSAGWFLENFRNLLVMEDRESLWLARATPRTWLEQGKKISVKNAPTYFGTAAYEVVSDLNHGRITATIEIPSRKPPRTVLLRLRHPQQKPIKSVTVDGKAWSDFDPMKEIVRLRELRGAVRVEALH